MYIVVKLRNKNGICFGCCFCCFKCCFSLWKLFYAMFYGTGSYPCPPQGWQRKILLIVRNSPLNGPCFLNASRAYWEHVGVNLQQFGLIGDMQI